jgi:hypothetical protein
LDPGIQFRGAADGRRPWKLNVSSRPEKVNDADRCEVVGARRLAEQPALGQAVAVLVQIDTDAVATEI